MPKPDNWPDGWTGPQPESAPASIGCTVIWIACVAAIIAAMMLWGCSHCPRCPECTPEIVHDPYPVPVFRCPDPDLPAVELTPWPTEPADDCSHPAGAAEAVACVAWYVDMARVARAREAALRERVETWVRIVNECQPPNE